MRIPALLRRGLTVNVTERLASRMPLTFGLDDRVRLRGLAPGGPADYEKLAPLTMGVFVLLIGVSAIVITADFVNPILLPG